MPAKKQKTYDFSSFKNIISNSSNEVLKEIARCILWKTGNNLITDIQLYKQPDGMTHSEYCTIIYNELTRRKINPWVK